MMTINRRGLLKALAAAPLLVPGILRAQDMSRIALAPIEVRDRRVWMPVRFAGGAPHRFVIDTGSFSNLISEALAAELDLRRIGRTRVRGIGGAEQLDDYRAPDVSLGEVRVGPMIFSAYRSHVVIHPEARGALSTAIMTVADTDLDFDAGVWRLHLDGRSDRSGFEQMPSNIRWDGIGSGADKIFVDVAIDGETYRLKVDTGSPSEIMLGSVATRRSRLWNETTPFSPHRRRGIGGDGGRARLVRVRGASLGGIAFERPLVSLTDPAERWELEEDGLLGIGLIERLNLSTDMRTRKLWAKRNGRPPRPNRYGMSGLWLEARRDGIEIAELSPGSPAADAGLRRGDVLVGGTLESWIERLGGRPGETIEISYRRGSETGTATLTLREYL
jgi:serine protease Do